MIDQAIECARGAGAILMTHFGRVGQVRVKGARSSVVTDADLESDRWIADRLRRVSPEYNLLSEESGFAHRGSAWTWVVDPLDGTSNFAAGIPWFGVMIALLHGTEPVVAALYLPAEDALYAAERGRGATRNGQTVKVSPEPTLAKVLCGYGLDGEGDPAETARQAAALTRLAHRARNVRATNSLVDFAFTIDGRLGACVNFHTMLWDIAAPLLVMEEAGGRMTDLTGAPLTFSLGPDACERSYAVVGGSPALQREALDALAWAQA